MTFLKMSEQDLTILIVDWVKRIAKLPVIHIANERRTFPRTGKILQKMGVRKGAADLFFPKGNKDYSGLWIELKIKPNKPTAEQNDFLMEMLGLRYDCAVCYSFEEARAVIGAFYGIKV